MNPSVSVIMPAFNADQFITEAILSILNQSFDKEIEIIVVDDNSTDNTKEIVKSLGREHNEIVLLDNKRSKGPSGARNTGLLEARCDFIAFLDADDLWTNNHLLEGTNFLSRNTDVDAVFYNFHVFP